MNSAEQKCWAALGWDEDSREEETDPPAFDDKYPPAFDDKYWEELTSQEQAAAEQIGYTQPLWDEE